MDLQDARRTNQVTVAGIQARGALLAAKLCPPHGAGTVSGRSAPVALEPLAHDARVLPQVMGLRCHDRFRLAELTDLAVQSLPSVLFQEIVRDLRPRTRNQTPESATTIG